MNRPTCETCIHWSYDGHLLEPDQGYCLLNPPTLLKYRFTMEHGDEQLWGQPVSCSGDSCSHHPDFPSYLASLKKPEPNQ